MHGFYVSEGLLAPEHYKRIGPAIWEFLWLIDHETKDGGKVLNGAPITIERIRGELGGCERIVRYHLQQLETFGYIKRVRLKHQTYTYTITHSKKWLKAPVENCRSSEKHRQDIAGGSGNIRPEAPAKNCRANKEDRHIRHIRQKENPPTPLFSQSVDQNQIYLGEINGQTEARPLSAIERRCMLLDAEFARAERARPAVVALAQALKANGHRQAPRSGAGNNQLLGTKTD